MSIKRKRSVGVTTLLSKIVKGGRYFIFPQSCLHCGVLLEEKNYLCPSCTSFLSFIDHSNRCERCFSPLVEGRCSICQKREFLFTHFASLFPGEEVARSLFEAFQNEPFPRLVKSMASFFVIGWERFHWSFPDLILFAPMSLGQRIGKGSDLGALVAKEMGKMMGVLSTSALQCVASSSKGESSYLFSIKKNKELYGKNILLIDVVWGSKPVFFSCARRVKECSPKGLDLLSFI